MADVPTRDPQSNPVLEVSTTSPIGSKTGAPKKRSVEILQTLEDSERNVYSGVFGYWCVGGGGDWSVTIRSCFKHDDRHHYQPSSKATRSTSSSTDPDAHVEEWVMGAGGDITALSDPQAEWEMLPIPYPRTSR
jgi:para-aminobenzoate synthetase